MPDTQREYWGYMTPAVGINPPKPMEGKMPRPSKALAPALDYRGSKCSGYAKERGLWIVSGAPSINMAEIEQVQKQELSQYNPGFTVWLGFKQAEALSKYFDACYLKQEVNNVCVGVYCVGKGADDRQTVLTHDGFHACEVMQSTGGEPDFGLILHCRCWQHYSFEDQKGPKGVHAMDRSGKSELPEDLRGDFLVGKFSEV